jgi:hypothetical protein
MKRGDATGRFTTQRNEERKGNAKRGTFASENYIFSDNDVCGISDPELDEVL